MFEQESDQHLIESEETFQLLTELHNSSSCTQRELSTKLNVSLGKINYLIKEMIKRGFVSVKSFSSNPQKFKKVRYFITKKGFKARVDLTYYYLKKKEKEFYKMKHEWEKLKEIEHELETFEVNEHGVTHKDINQENGETHEAKKSDESADINEFIRSV